MEITFGKKFTQKDLDAFIGEYLSASLETTDSEIIFHLEQLEWISAEEITFLFAWLSKLNSLKKNTIIKMPLSTEIIGDEIDIDRKENLKRRNFIKFYLWKIWKMHPLSQCDNLHFENIDNIYNLYIEYEHINFAKKILPFQIIKTDLDSRDAVDKKFYKNTENHFDLTKEIKDLLNVNNCYSPFENKIISEIITKELFMNSAEHAKTEECYFTAAFRDKWKTSEDNQRFIDHFLQEKESYTLDFYRDKEKVTTEINKKISVIDVKSIKERRPADLSKQPEYNKFRKQSFVEFTFIDFGEGIFSTLKNDYKKNKDKYKIDLSGKAANIESDILETAFLLSSSKDPFDNRIEKADLIPRGLYFLIDMVRRYKGLLVARSGYGKVVYDFSDRINIIPNDSKLQIEKETISNPQKSVIQIKEHHTYFPGTMISIVLPERKKEIETAVRTTDKDLLSYIKDRDNGIFDPIDLFNPKDYIYLDFSFLYSAYDDSTYNAIYNSPKGVINAIFSVIDKKLKELNDIGENCVLFIDFEDLPKQNYLYKILTYLSNSPLVNEKIKLIAINIDDVNLNILIKEYGVGNDDKTPFLFKAIPCLKLDKSDKKDIKIIDVKWIGVNKAEDANFLTDLFIGKRDSIPLNWLIDQHVCEGNIISHNQDNTRAISLLDFNLLENEINKIAKDNSIWRWIGKDVIKDGEKIDKKHPKNTLFLTSQGSYQTKYISFYESLNFKFTAEYFAQFLLGEYIKTCKDDFERKTTIDINNVAEIYRIFIKRSFLFDKILAVTVSSQFLAVEFRNLIRRNKDAYAFLISDIEEENDKKVIQQVECLIITFRELINSNKEPKENLSKIQDFFSENKAIIKEYYDYYQKIQYKKDIKIKHCPELIQLSSYFSFEAERPFKKIKEHQRILIVNDVISTGSLIKKMIEKIKEKNAIVNCVLSIADSRNRVEPDMKGIECESVFPEEELENKELKIISIISTTKNPEFIIRKYKDRKYVVEQIYKTTSNNVEIKRINPVLNTVVTMNTKHAELRKVLFNDPHKFLKYENIYNDNFFKIGHFKQSLPCTGYYMDMHNLCGGERGENVLKMLKEKIEEIESIHPFLIMYPVHCAIEEISDEIFQKVFGTDISYVVMLQRYETPYGWRFAFPPKRFNKRLKGKEILIIDSGSLSGQSLVQLIDAVSVYEVEKINVLSIIGRLDDFHREFYSKLQTMTVKFLDEEGRDKIKPIADINVFWGINLHIPSHHNKDNCHFCKELKFLEEYKQNSSLPIETQTYIGNRIREIDIQESEEKTTATYIPHRKDNGEIDYVEIFKMRDDLGKIDGYRFYEDYFCVFDNLCAEYSANRINDLLNNSNNDLQQFELILICVLHEPHLIGCIKDLLRNLYDILFELIKSIIADNSYFKEASFYTWNEYPLLRLYYTFVGEENFYTPETFETVFRFCDNVPDALNYASFLLAREGYKLKVEPTRQHHRISEILLHLDKKVIPDTKCYARGVINRLRNSPNIIENVSTVKDAFDTLYKFFVKIKSNGMHGELFIKFSQLDMAKDNPIETDDRYQLYVNAIEYIIEEIKIYIYNCLKKIKDDASLIHHCFDGNEYNMLFHNDKCVFTDLEQIINDYNTFERNDTTIKKLAKILCDFEEAYMLDLNGHFFKYCNNQMSYVKDVFKEVKNRLTINKSKLQINDDNLENRLIPLHKSFLDKLIDEILKNAINYADTQNKQITLDVSTKLNADSSYYNLLFEQNTGFFNPDNRQGGTKEIIEKLLETFFQNKYHITHTPKYIIEINVTNE